VRLFHQIAALVVLAAALPLATVGFLLVRLNERALEREVCARFDQTARHAAEAVAAKVDEKAHLLARTAQAVPWQDLDGDEARGALQLLAGELGGQAAALYDVAPEGARPLVEWRDPRLDGDPLGAHLPAKTALAGGASTVALSEVLHGPDGAVAVVAATTVGERRVLAVALPLGELQARIESVRRDGDFTLYLVERDGQSIVGAPRITDGPRDLRALAPVAAAVAGEDGAARRRGDLVGAHAPVGGFGWIVVVVEDAGTALAAPRAMRRLTLVGTGAAALVAIALAFLFARRLAAALARLAAAARALAGGDLAHRIRARGSDEVADLGGTFDRMADQLASSRAEIEGWNRELEARVAARTEELRQAQAQLVEAQKLAALGQLGAGVAHEINNPLGGVIGHVQLLIAEHPPGHADHEALKCIEEAARKASTVVHNLLRFSVQRKAPVYTSVDLNRLIKETLTLTEALIHDAGIALAVELANPAPRVWGDAGQLGQVLLNLLNNARTATPSGGRIVVRSATDGARGAFAVEDSGKGIAAEHRARIFEPFFTTKDEWSNVGLGLSVSFRIVSEHRGEIAVDSEPGRGARFTVAVPRDPPAVEASA